LSYNYRFTGDALQKIKHGKIKDVGLSTLVSIECSNCQFKEYFLALILRMFIKWLKVKRSLSSNQKIIHALHV
jgi:predicted nucleic-acid-binding Zn-ribbon protein